MITPETTVAELGELLRKRNMGDVQVFLFRDVFKVWVQGTGSPISGTGPDLIAALNALAKMGKS